MKQKHEVAVLYCQKMRLQEEETLLLKEMKNFIVYFKKHVISDLEHDIECKTYLTHFFHLLYHVTNTVTAVERLVLQQDLEPCDHEYYATSPVAQTQVSIVTMFCCLLLMEFYTFRDTALIPIMLQWLQLKDTWLYYSMASIWPSCY